MDTTLDFTLTFTDPGRDDLTGHYGAIASETYWWTDPLDTAIWSTASTYNAYYNPDIVGLGFGGYMLDGYQGAGDFRGAAPRTKMSVIVIAWAESPIPEPATALLLGLGLLGIAGLRRNLKK
ncbi:MAG: hypothetical protein CVU54_09925 [Deltaproteobacteria bacterium HGW-Deltaproteobacteria-12]|jgi:hypothetical protein|nr:MAG: hypothetical protein CVU54_09925 [Deltaproteobacteria bacterium HGW-Deltaproteobacteria-12]